VSKAMERALRLSEADFQHLREMHFRRRDPADVEAGIASPQKQRGPNLGLIGRIDRERGLPPRDEARQKAVAGLRAGQELCDQAIAYLRVEGPKQQDEKDIKQKHEAADDRKDDWDKLDAKVREKLK